MANTVNKNSITRALVNTQDTEPASSALTGTVAIAAGGTDVVGVGTLFLTQIKVGEYIYIVAENEIRRVATVVSNTLLTIENIFTNNIVAGTTIRRVPLSDRKEISFVVTGANAILVDGVSWPTNSFGGWTTSGRSTGNADTSRDFVDPIIFDSATSGASTVNIIIKKG